MSKSAWKPTDGPNPILPLSNDEYESISFAWRALTAVAEIEDLWEIVVQNYTEIENTFLQSALRSMIEEDFDIGQRHSDRLKITRCLMNLLSSCRAYLYQVERNLEEANCGQFVKTFKELTKREYDGNPSYAFMEALRNHAQHHGLPLHRTSVGGSWALIETARGKRKGTLRFQATASIVLDKLRADPKFKRAALEKFPSRDRLDVARLAREYVEALSQVHADLRVAMAASVTRWKSVILELLERYAAEANCVPLFILVGEYSVSNPNHGIQIFEGMITGIDKMAIRNPALVNLSRRYVSSELDA